MSVRWRYILFTLFLGTVSTWLAVLYYPNHNLRIIACDVGQGDAFLITYGKIQVLVDGGPNNKVIECLSRYLPFWDRKIEMVVLSHPQRDHYLGLIEVFKRYKVETFVNSGLDSSSQEFSLLKSQVGGNDVKVVNATAKMIIRLGLIYLDILHPSEEFLAKNSFISKNLAAVSGSKVLGIYTANEDPNLFSVVFILSYKDFNALFTGDINPEISDELAKLLIKDADKSIEYIKIPHHGSKNGLTKDLLDAVEPKIAVISVAKGNSYGHPHNEVIKLLSEKGVKILRTDKIGDVVVETDGRDVWSGE